MSRLVAEMMPTVTRAAEAERIADGHHPIAHPHLGGIPELAAFSGFFGSTFSSARSVLGSWPRILVTFSLEPSVKLTMISSAPSMT